MSLKLVIVILKGIPPDYATASILLIILGLVLALYHLFSVSLKREKLKIKLLELESRAIRAQMNPHFIFNAISSIQNYILENDTKQSYDYLSKFALLIRNVLDNSKEEYITLSKEISALKLYIELEQLRFKEPFKIIVDIDKKINAERVLIPTMLIQPYIENAIWHGLMPKQTNATLTLEIKKAEKYLKIIITDNGIGREESKKYKANLNYTSKEINSISERIKSLSKGNNKKYSVTVKDLKNKNGNSEGTEISILLDTNLEIPNL